MAQAKLSILAYKKVIRKWKTTPTRGKMKKKKRVPNKALGADVQVVCINDDN